MEQETAQVIVHNHSDAAIETTYELNSKGGVDVVLILRQIEGV